MLPSPCRVTAALDLDLRGGTVLWLLASYVCSACWWLGGGRVGGMYVPLSQAGTDWPKVGEVNENLHSVIRDREADSKNL